MDTTNQLGFFSIIGTLVTFGAFGGILASLNEASLKEVRESGIKAYGNGWRLFSCITIGALWGAGGAMAFGAIASIDGKLDNFTQAKQLQFALISVASGFAGLQFLILVSRRLNKEVNEAVQKETQKVQQVMEENAKKQNQLLEELNEAVNALGHALALQKTDSTFVSVVREAKRKGEKAILTHSTNRTLVILLGRLDHECATGSIDSAIRLLSQAIAEWKRKKLTLDDDYAAILFNRACYKNIKSDTLEAENHKDLREELKASAWEDLKESCKHDSHNQEEAKNDSDLTSLVTNGRSWNSFC